MRLLPLIIAVALWPSLLAAQPLARHGHVNTTTACVGQGCGVITACRMAFGALTPEWQICSDGAQEVSFDGTTFDIAANLTLDGGTSTPVWKSETSGSNNSGGTFQSYATLTAANGAIFTLGGFWNSTQVAQFRFRSGADTTNKDEGRFELRLAAPGGTLTNRLQILEGGEVGLSNSTPSSTLQIGAPSDATDSYLQPDWESGEPPSADCDSSAEYGREIYDSATDKRCRCLSTGWECAGIPPLLIVLSTYDAQPARTAASYIHGGFVALATGQALDSVPTDVTFTTGIGKLYVVINAGSDVAGSITVTGKTIDRETGAGTPADTDTLTVSTLSTDSTTTDTNGNSKYAITDGYLTAKWFTGSVTLSTSDLTLTDVDVYHVSFEQLNDTSPSFTVRTYDVNLFTTNAAADFDSYLQAVDMQAGDLADILLLAELHLGADGETTVANLYYRLRKGNIDQELDGATDGVWTATHYNATAHIEDVSTKLWATIPQ